MLSAAFDIIHRLSGDDPDTPSNSGTNGTEFNNSCTLVNGSYKGREHCEKAGTSVSELEGVCERKRRREGGGKREREKEREI